MRKFNVFHRVANRYRHGRIKWIKSNRDDGRGGHCVLGALNRLHVVAEMRKCTNIDKDWYEVIFARHWMYIEFLDSVCHRLHGMSVMHFNDSASTKRKDILKLLDETGNRWDEQTNG